MHYKELEIWKLSRLLVIEIHQLTLQDLPKFEMFESGSQIRRSIKSVKANIVEGFARRDYKQEFFHFLLIAEGSAEETKDHLETLFETGSLKSEEKYRKIHHELELLVRMLYSFRRSMRSSHFPPQMK